MLIKLITVILMMYPVLENMDSIKLNNTGTGKLALNFIKVLKAFYDIYFARKLFSMVHKTLSTLV